MSSVYACVYVNVIASFVCVCVDCLWSLLTNPTQGSFNTVLMNRGFDLAKGSEPQAHTHTHIHARGEEFNHCLLP